uniref:uncharacterized protein LOC120329029 isoform X1 n=1 Tax=Styela clava TaxID=7725 RepID=UPI00193ACE03|nr:uncharacterized protein LOC120329029 isoform X1 [Styela clava]
MYIRIKMKVIYTLIITIALIVGGINGRRTSGTKRKKKEKNGGIFSVDTQKDEIPGWPSMDVIFEAVSPRDYGIPRQCSESELKTILKRCVIIWQSYCKCKHCESCEQKWPPTETKNWNNGRNHIGWEQLDESWKWVGKCAYNATNLWRIWCGEQGEITNRNTSQKEEYKYWFLLNIDANFGEEKITQLCIEHECPEKPTSEETKTKMGEENAKYSTTSPANAVTYPGPYGNENFVTMDIRVELGRNGQDKDNQDISDALGTSQLVFSENCDNDELNEILKRCIIIWQEYCRCAGCDNTCGEEEWPPKATDAWRVHDRKIGWEELDGAWKWAAKCAHNATELWRFWCYDWAPGINEELTESEHEHWFLTQLGMNTHPKIVHGLCQSYECQKFNLKLGSTTTEELEPYTRVVSKNIEITTYTKTTGKQTNTAITNDGATLGSSNGTTVPKWAYIIIAVLGAIVIIFFVLCCMFLYYRGRYKKERSDPQIVFDGRRGETSATDSSTNWQHQTSFTFFGERALPGIDESIYHTITDAPAPPASPTFAMASFSPPKKTTQRSNAGQSVTNVLYHDTIPKYAATSDPKSSNTNRSDQLAEPHTYEDTGNILSITSPGNFESANTPPYFVPTSAVSMNEYDTLGLGDVQHNEQQKDEPEVVRRQNYDHIQLL